MTIITDTHLTAMTLTDMVYTDTDTDTEDITKSTIITIPTTTCVLTGIRIINTGTINRTKSITENRITIKGTILTGNLTPIKNVTTIKIPVTTKNLFTIPIVTTKGVTTKGVTIKSVITTSVITTSVITGNLTQTRRSLVQ